MEIAVLCAHRKSHYFQIPGLDVYDEVRDCRTFTGTAPVICHPPCAQWSRLRGLSRPDPETKNLAWFCLEKLWTNGGVFEHPSGSEFFKIADFPPGRMYSVDQSWFGFPARKKTLLYFVRCRPVSFPLNFDMITHKVGKGGTRGNGYKEVSKFRVALTPLAFDQWLVDSIRDNFI